MLFANTPADLKSAAKTATRFLSTHGIQLKHAQALDLAARMVNSRNYATALAKLSGFVKVEPSTRAIDTVTNVCRACGSDLTGHFCGDATCPYSDWPQHVNRDLMESLPTEELESKCKVFKRLRVSGRVRADNHQWDAEFDCTQWFAQASNKELIDLHSICWMNDYQADEVADFFDGVNDGITYFFKQIRRFDCGFECSIVEHEAMEWLRVHRTPIWAQLLCTEQEVDVFESSVEGTIGLWDWKSSHGGCEMSLDTKEEALLDAVTTLRMGDVPPAHYQRCTAHPEPQKPKLARKRKKA